MGLNKTWKEFPGGLLVEFPLPEFSLHDIFVRIVDAECNIENLSKEFMNDAKCAINGLFEAPTNLQTYVTKQRIYSSLSWACDKKQIENLSCESKIYPVDDQLFKVRINSEFCDHNEIRCSSHIRLTDVQDPGCHLLGRVVDYDPVMSTLTFFPYGRRRIKEDVDYAITAHPSSFVFRSRCRTLTWLLALYMEDFIFPKEIDENALSQAEFARAESDMIPQMKFSQNLNSIQRKAIFGMISGIHGSLPYILHGPPGTGKTTVLVETVRLLLEDEQRNNRILVCTPSNTAADVFAVELLKKAKIPESKLFRMYSLKRPVETQNADLRNVMCVCRGEFDDEIFGIFRKEKLLQFQVVISTLCASTYLVTGGLNNKFSHIIIDEAGQASEVDTLIPIVGLATKNTRIILGGDPKQLGPVETLDFINENELSRSLLERFTELPCYQNDRRVICMLEENYRSHPAIIKIPSELFYYNRLFASPICHQKTKLCNWPNLPKLSFPILWHHVVGEEMQEPGGFSFANLYEIRFVMYYIENILETLDVKPQEIGVISPYKYQVRLLREVLSSFPEITVDSVERFQGSERRVIIVSTVRNGGIGFLRNNKRFNTTIMRAEELLVVIGNYVTLSSNSCWRSFIDYCEENGAVKQPNKEEKFEPESDDYPFNIVSIVPHDNSPEKQFKELQKCSEKLYTGSELPRERLIFTKSPNCCKISSPPVGVIEQNTELVRQATNHFGHRLDTSSP